MAKFSPFHHAPAADGHNCAHAVFPFRAAALNICSKFRLDNFRIAMSPGPGAPRATTARAQRLVVQQPDDGRSEFIHCARCHTNPRAALPDDARGLAGAGGDHRSAAGH